MKTVKWLGDKVPYVTPETELIETALETGLLVFTNGEAKSDVEDFEEEDYSGSIIWK